jgi:hypothetical protein
MAGFTLSEIRAAIGDQFRRHLAREINIDVDSEGKPAPVVRLELADSDPIDYWVTFGAVGLAAVRFDVVLEVAGADQSAVRRLDDFLSVGTGNGSSLVDAVFKDPTFGGACTAATSFEVAEYNAGTATAVCRLGVHVAKQGAEA